MQAASGPTQSMFLSVGGGGCTPYPRSFAPGYSIVLHKVTAKSLEIVVKVGSCGSYNLIRRFKMM